MNEPILINILQKYRIPFNFDGHNITINFNKIKEGMNEEMTNGFCKGTIKYIKQLETSYKNPISLITCDVKGMQHDFHMVKCLPEKWKVGQNVHIYYDTIRITSKQQWIDRVYNCDLKEWYITVPQ